MSDPQTTRTRMENAEARLARLEIVLRKIIQHADEATGGTEAYARDRLRQCRALAALGVERIIMNG